MRNLFKSEFMGIVWRWGNAADYNATPREKFYSIYRDLSHRVTDFTPAQNDGDSANAVDSPKQRAKPSSIRRFHFIRIAEPGRFFLGLTRKIPH